jgi:CubicO group peptidase (beta-lactamase class C family)
VIDNQLKSNNRGEHIMVRGGLAAAVLVIVGWNGMAQASDVNSAIEAALQKYVDSGEISGGVGLVASPGSNACVAVGETDTAKGTPMGVDSLFGVMSMTKPITATALMILVEEGKVSLDDPVEKYIPAFAEAKTASGEAVRGLTVRRLLTHTSGLTGDQGCNQSLEATANALARRPFAFQPGEKWEYGPSLNVVGRIVEVASGQSFEEFLDERIFQPLEMTNTTFHPSDEQRAKMAVLYKKGGDGKSLVLGERWGDAGEPGCVPNPSGGLFSTASDMAKFYRSILAGGEPFVKQIVSRDSAKQMTTVQYPELSAGFVPGTNWGLGWCIVEEPQGVTEALSSGSFGHGGAYGTQGWVDPEKKRISARTSATATAPTFAATFRMRR